MISGWGTRAEVKGLEVKGHLGVKLGEVTGQTNHKTLLKFLLNLPSVSPTNAF